MFLKAGASPRGEIEVFARSKVLQDFGPSFAVIFGRDVGIFKPDLLLVYIEALRPRAQYPKVHIKEVRAVLQRVTCKIIGQLVPVSGLDNPLRQRARLIAKRRVAAHEKISAAFFIVRCARVINRVMKQDRVKHRLLVCDFLSGVFKVGKQRFDVRPIVIGALGLAVTLFKIGKQSGPYGIEHIDHSFCRAVWSWVRNNIASSFTKDSTIDSHLIITKFFFTDSILGL